MKRAVVDVGSNSVLLTVMESGAHGWQEVYGTSEVTGLGSETRRSGLLSEESQAKTLAAIHRAFEHARSEKAPCVAAATMAVRIARNAQEFLDRAEMQATPVLVISGDEEAALGLDAVMHDPAFRSHQRVSVIDPGGHSTELTVAERNADVYDVAFKKSFSIGALGLLDGPMGSDRPGVSARLSAVDEIDTALEADPPPVPGGTAVALGATPINLVRIRDGVTEWDASAIHGKELTYEEISRRMAELCDMSEQERADLPGIERGREKTLHVGALILERFLNSLRVEGCLVSTRGWRHAMVEKSLYFSN